MKVQAFDAKIQAFERDMYQFNLNLDANQGTPSATVDGLQASAENFRGVQGAGQAATRDRNVFDPREYKLADLGPKLTVVRWKEWRRDLEGFVDTIGLSWKGTSGLLRQLRYRDQPCRELPTPRGDRRCRQAQRQEARRVRV